MPKPRRLPHVMVEVGVGKNSKLAALPSDTARLGYFYVVLGEAKLQRPAGRFASRGLWREVSGRFARFLADYLREGLMHEVPTKCERCCERFGEVPKGTLLVHDWHLHQVDPGAADRAEEWRLAHQGDEPQPPEPAFDDRSMPVQSAFDERSIPVRSSRTRRAREARGEPELERESLTVDSLGNSNGQSPADRHRPPDRETERAGDVLSQLLSAEQAKAWLTFGPEWDEFKRAWIGRGLHFPPAGGADDDPDAEHPSQRAMLHSVLVDRPSDLPEWVRASKARTAHEVVAFVLERWHALRQPGPMESPAKPPIDATEARPKRPDWMAGS